MSDAATGGSQDALLGMLFGLPLFLNPVAGMAIRAVAGRRRRRAVPLTGRLRNPGRLREGHRQDASEGLPGALRFDAVRDGGQGLS